MLNNFPSKKNKQHEHTGVSPDDYIETAGDSLRNTFVYMSPEVEAELQGSIHDMRRQFRATAKRMRGAYANSE